MQVMWTVAAWHVARTAKSHVGEPGWASIASAAVSQIAASASDARMMAYRASDSALSSAR